MLPEHRQLWVGDRPECGRQLRMHGVAVTEVDIQLSQQQWRTIKSEVPLGFEQHQFPRAWS